MSAAPSSARIAELLAPYTEPLSTEALDRIAVYLDLLLRWNARTNLTAVRDPEQLVQRQVGESLFAARLLDASPDLPASTLLDFGSGAGFPGIPLAIALPQLGVTLAESQGKKASFLREAVRTLGVTAEVYGGRVESMPVDRSFSTVVMRAVDTTATMLSVATNRVAPRGQLLRYLSSNEPIEVAEWRCAHSIQLPLSQGQLCSWRRNERSTWNT